MRFRFFRLLHRVFGGALVTDESVVATGHCPAVTFSL